MKTIQLTGQSGRSFGLALGLGVMAAAAWSHPVAAVGAVAEPASAASTASAASRPASGMYHHRLTAQERAVLREKLRQLHP